MKKYFSFLLLGFLLVSFSTNAQESENKTTTEEINSKVEVYYFHGDRRCKTCIAVGSVSKEYLEEKYSKEIEAGKLSFHDVNYDQAENKELAEQMEVSGSSLLVKKTDGSEISTEDLTNLAFMYALANPQKLKDALQKEIDSIF